ncbi:P-loop containing nucleoside triphosphate hydrolase protein [Syncephalis plumigaleata]|nr:P-loop containing nucleoside triphosphate hydrolase protein [Syncephalis plumigaleata]
MLCLHFYRNSLARQLTMKGGSKQVYNITFCNITYSVITKTAKNRVAKIVLDNVNGCFEAGKVTAIVGPSGAGKTSLINALAGQINDGDIYGELYLNEQLVQSKDIYDVSGFVYQDDIVYHAMTVREAVFMSARLRCPHYRDDNERGRHVQRVLGELSLEESADTVIGDWYTRGISGGERKRTCVAMELVRDPAILFLDEPTTGLDTLTANHLMHSLQNVAYRGRTVVATLHQPSSDILGLIDNIIFLAEGRIIYSGPVTEIVDYFSRLDLQCPDYRNPVDFLFLRIFYDQDDDYNLLENKHHQNNRKRNKNGCKEAASIVQERLETLWEAWRNYSKEMSSTSKTAAAAASQYSIHVLDNRHSVQLMHTIEYEEKNQMVSFWTQSGFLIRRSVRYLIRNPNSLIVKLLEVIVASILFNFVYWDIPSRSQMSQMMDKAGFVYFMNAVAVAKFSFVSVPAFCDGRVLLIREYRGKYYNLPAYFISTLITEVPILIVVQVIFSLTTYYSAGLNSDPYRVSMFMLNFLLLTLIGFTIGMARAMAIVVLFSIPIMICGGLFSKGDAMPGWIRWLRWLSPMKYGFTSMLKNEFEGTIIGCGDNPSDDCTPIPGSAAISYYGLSDDGSVLFNTLMIIAYCVAVIVIAFTGYNINMYRERRSFKRKFKPVNELTAA